MRMCGAQNMRKMGGQACNVRALCRERRPRHTCIMCEHCAESGDRIPCCNMKNLARGRKPAPFTIPRPDDSPGREANCRHGLAELWGRTARRGRTTESLYFHTQVRRLGTGLCIALEHKKVSRRAQSSQYHHHHQTRFGNHT